MTSRKLVITIALLGTLVGLISACNQQKDSTVKEQTTKPESDADQMLLERAQNLFGEMPEPASFDRPIAQLGKKLYYEKELSISKQMSCNTCHMLDKFGVDNEPTSLSHDKSTRGERNSPTVYNAYMHASQFWDGRAEDLVAQAKGPVLNPVEMAMPDEATVTDRLMGSEEYKALFAEAFPEEEMQINYHNMAIAIAEFEKTLATPSAFDTYLDGNIAALNEDQRIGLKTFMDVGCTTCHSGPALGGQLMQKFGLIKGPYWEYTGSESIDSGRVTVTGSGLDKFVFKVPSLRNIEETAPYFHDGSVADLDEAIRIMGTTQLGKELTAEEVAKIRAFLKTLTGEIPEYALIEEKEKLASM